MGCLRTRLVLELVVLSFASLALASDGKWTEKARYAFKYQVDFGQLRDLHVEQLRVWVPYPAENRDQKIVSVQIDSPWKYRTTRDDLGNRMLYLEGTGVPSGPLTMRFVVERRPSHGVPGKNLVADTPSDPQRYLHPNKLIPLDGLIRQVAARQSKSLTTDPQKVRAFYDYVVKNMRYNKDGKGWGRGDAIWACTNKRGNCTDFHSLFIGMARSQGIPARFIIGFPIPDSAEGTIPGYHCWAQYYDKQRGWVPVDASEANKSGNPDAYFGTLPNDRIQFTTGRDLTLAPAQQGPPLNYFIYPYAEADGKPIEKLSATFSFERLPLTLARP
jgi:transglutaminase-like putative cysteine protease